MSLRVHPGALKVPSHHGSPPESPPLQLMLLNGFQLERDGETLPIPAVAQRLMALLSLHKGPVRRQHAAGRLWLDVPDDRAAASLRSTLWRLRQADPTLVATTGTDLGLGRAVSVDYLAAKDLATRIVRGELRAWSEDPLDALGFDLLPDWQEEWVVIEREQYRQMRLHALEILCAGLSTASRHGEAVRAGQLAVSCEPLRESAQRSLISAFLAEGNESEARRQFDAYRRLLNEELGVAPSSETAALVEGGAGRRSSPVA